MQREVIVGIDEACKIYNETTPSMKRSKQGLGEVISKTHTKIIKSIRIKKFKKLLAVADSRNGMEFLEEVNFIYNLYYLLLDLHT
jgi:hypothetical protein